MRVCLIFRRIIWLGVWMLSLCAWAQEEETRAMRVILFGDEMTRGDGLDSMQTFGKILASQVQELGIPAFFLNAGKGEDRTDLAIARMQQDVVVKRPDVVLVMYGGYDAMVDEGKVVARVPLNIYTKQVTQIVSFLKSIDVTPILMTVPPIGMTEEMEREPYSSAGPNFLLEPYMESCRKLAKELRIPLVDHFQHWKRLEEEGENLSAYRLDGFLPNEKGHQELAKLIFPVLKDELGPKYVPVFQPADTGYVSYHDPALVTTKSGFLLALAVAKKNASTIFSADLVYKRSFDLGNTWTDLDTIASEGLSAVCKPTILQEEENGKLYLIYQVRPGFSPDKVYEVNPGTKGDNVAQVYVRTSEDEGRTWSEPEEITKSAKGTKDVLLLETGASNGVERVREKEKRVLLTAIAAYSSGSWQIFILQSDNQGKSWKCEGPLPGGEASQLRDPHLVEGKGETLYISAWDQEKDTRMKSTSTDGGKSWSAFEPDTSFSEIQQKKWAYL